MSNGCELALVAELAAQLAEFGRLRCTPTVEEEDGAVVLTVRFKAATEHDALQTLELYQALRELQDMTTVRALAARYDIDSAELEALFKRRD